MHVENDKSPQGYIDEDIVPLLEKLHSLGYKTTSSCSGRIVLIKNPGNKSKARWLCELLRPKGLSVLLQ